MFGFELVAAIAAAAVSLAVCIMSLNIPLALAPHFWASAGAFPFILGTLVFLLSSFWVVDVARRRAAQSGRSWLEEVFGPPELRRKLFFIAAMTVVYVFALIPLCGRISGEFGFLGATFIFLVGSLKTFSRFSFKGVLAVSAVAAVIIYVAFIHALFLPMPR